MNKKESFLKEIVEVAPKSHYISSRIVERYVREMDHEGLWNEFDDATSMVLDYLLYQDYQFEMESEGCLDPVAH